MRILPPFIVRMFDRVQIRLTRARPGSILVLVVVLIVLLALLGTASLSTTRSDRATAIQNSANTQVDMIIEGAIEIAKATILDDLYGAVNAQSVYRPPFSLATPTNYDHFDGYDLTIPPSPAVAATLPLQNDAWLSPRFPTAYPASADQPWPMWSSLGRLQGFDTFDSPITMKLRAGTGNNGLDLTDLSIPTVYTDRVAYTRAGTDLVHLMPNFMMPYGQADGRSLPAFVVSDPRGLGGGRFVLAGDADGDGMADSGFIKLPIGQVDGVTYYVATRIIDNNSAININTAWSNTSDFDFNHVWNPGRKDALGDAVVPLQNNLGNFPSHVGLLELIHVPTPLPVFDGSSAQREMFTINEYRSNEVAALPTAIDDSGGRTDFVWNTRGEAFAMNLARKLENPGSVTVGTRYRPFEDADSVSLAYRFTMQNREMPPGNLERLLLDTTGVIKDSVYASAGNDDSNPMPFAIFGTNKQQYLPSRRGIASWFDDNFHFEGYKGPSFTITGVAPQLAPLPHALNASYERPIRAMLTSSNPVSNQIPIKSLAGAGAIVLPSTVTTPDSPRRLLHPTGTPSFSYMPAYGSDPQNPIPTKANVNTAGFDELWRAYWCVMMEPGATTTPFLNSNQDDIYAGMRFNRDGDGGQFLPEPGVSQQRMFRSPLRDPLTGGGSPKYLTPQSMTVLRSAIAAVQTMQLRGQDGQDPVNVVEQPAVYERLVGIPIEGLNVPPENVRITIFGTTPQPFLTEIFAWKDIKTKDPLGSGEVNENAYLAIELYNPYPFPITMTGNYKLAKTSRNASYADAAGSTPMVLTDIYTFNNEVIPPGDFLVIHNLTDMRFLPQSAMLGTDLTSANSINIPGLFQLLEEEAELVIYQEIPNDLDPATPLKKAIDSFDFHSYIAGGGRMNSWHYARGCGLEDRWLCVYPGRYAVNTVGRQERHQGIDWREWDPEDNVGNTRNADPGFDPPYQPNLGRGSGTEPSKAADPAYSRTVPVALPIQLGNLDFGGPNKIKGGTGNKYPFGGFMRDGDILQVPYIAAYTITIHSSPADPGILFDMNSVSMDAAFAEDSDPEDDSKGYATQPGVREQVGRFAPIRVGPDSTPLVNDYGDDQNLHRYAWARDLFDYLSVTTPSRDTSPEYPMQREWHDLGGAQKTLFKGSLYSTFSITGLHEIWLCNTTGQQAMGSDPGTAGLTRILGAISVKNGKADAAVFGVGPAAETENDVGTQGLININTAPWKVLSAIPWVAPGTDRFSFSEWDGQFAAGANNRDDNEDIARAIVFWRDGNALNVAQPGNGPFRSLFDLYRVRVPADPATPGVYVFDLVQNTLFNAGNGPDDAQGDFSPYNTNPAANGDAHDHARYDFEEQYYLLTKVSNLLTTRSDTFTVYIQVQGWRGVGTIRPELVVQRRTAFFVDRSKITRTGGDLKAVNVPND